VYIKLYIYIKVKCGCVIFGSVHPAYTTFSPGNFIVLKWESLYSTHCISFTTAGICSVLRSSHFLDLILHLKSSKNPLDFIIIISPINFAVCVWLCICMNAMNIFLVWKDVNVLKNMLVRSTIVQSSELSLQRNIFIGVKFYVCLSALPMNMTFVIVDIKWNLTKNLVLKHICLFNT